MPMWRCPHCGTPQAEASRCWVCKRSSTSCGTCRHFRRAVAGTLGYCGLDRRRTPLRGDELRGCWEAWPALVDERPASIAAESDDPSRPRLDFVPLQPAEDDPAPATPPPAWQPPPDGSLWADLD